MLSKKMTVSLMSLITILAMAFMVAPAMAQKEFKVTFTGRTSVPHAVSAADNGTAAVTMIALKVVTDQPVANPLGLTIKTFGTNGLEVVTNPATIELDADMDNTAKVRYYNVTVPAELATEALLPLKLVVEVPVLTSNDPAAETKDNANKSKKSHHVIEVTKFFDTYGTPKVVSIQRLRPGSQTVVAAFQESIVTDPSFDVRIVFTEEWNVDLAKVGDILAVSNGTASNVVKGLPFARLAVGADEAAQALAGNTLRPHPIEGMYQHLGTGSLQGIPNMATAETITDAVPMPTDSDDMYHQYRVTITPHTKSADFDLKISVKAFDDGDSPLREFYAPMDLGHKPNGREELRLKVKGTARNLTAGYKVTIPKDWIIPANGYLVIARDLGGSEIVDGPGWRTNDTPRRTHRTEEQVKYNVIGVSSLPNLATQFANGVVVDVQSQHAGLVVSEVMWGEDVSLDPSSKSQYIELYNPGGQYKTVADADHTPDVNEALTLIFYAPNEFGAIPAAGTDGSLPAGITDRIGTLDATGSYWSPAAKGQSGRSGTTATGTAAERGDFVPVVPIVSMYREMVPDTSTGAAADAMMPADGQMAASWMSSAGPKSTNFDPLAIGIRHGTPGAATDATTTPADTAAEAKAKAAAAAAAAAKAESTGTVPQDGQIYVSEVMFAGGGTLPQWIEISNGSRTEEVNLSGWTLTVNNAVADADVSVGPTIMFTIPDGTKIMPSAQNEKPSTLLVVTEIGRNNIPAASGQVLNLWQAGQTELILAGVTKRRYSLLSDMAFEIVLAPPAPTATKLAATATAAQKAAAKAADATAMLAHTAATDMAGNLGADGAATWALPMSDEGGRSSIIRKHVQVSIGPAEPEDGAMMESWGLASETSFAQATHVRASSYYGAANDVGTPGFRAGGALPVELSHFRPARQETGAVVITWSTQSELNNAGFFIKRSQQRDGEFKVINATMVAGAGTTSEKQSYTYTDTTAQPNVVYYYQIEDVSLDGQRQTLTNGIRLKGHIGAAGKLTSTWGELKSSNE